jgi:hypothetical protein
MFAEWGVIAMMIGLIAAWAGIVWVFFGVHARWRGRRGTHGPATPRSP